MFFFILPVCTGKEWIIGANLSSVTSHGSSITEIRHFLQDGDTLLIYGPDTINDCVTSPIKISLNIIGIGGNPVRLNSTCGEFPNDTNIIQNDSPFLRFFGSGATNPTVSIKNIHFLRGLIFATDVNLYIRDSIFNQSTVRFMGDNETISYDRRKFRLQALQETLLHTTGENPCNFATLNLSNTVWEKTYTEKPSTVPEAAGFRDDIFIKCAVATINLDKNNLGNRRLHVYVRDSIAFNATNLTFEGLEVAENKVGGISVLFPKDQHRGHFVIKDSSFTNLIPKSVFFGRLFSNTVKAAPIALFTVKSERHSSNDNNNTELGVKIFNCNFTGNQRGIILQSLYVPVLIRDCVFHGNKVLIQGGAVTTKAELLNIIHCSFINNEAGAIDAYEEQSGEILFYGLEEGHIVRFCTTENLVEHRHSNWDNETIVKTHGKAGGGGALYIDGGNVYISNSSFKGNLAYDSGGAIYLSNKVNAVINNSYFVNSPNISSILEGYLIFSVGESLKVSNVTLNVSLTPENDVDSSALFYFGRRGKCYLNSVHMICPTNFKIQPFNSSSQPTNENNMSQIFDTLYYSCEKCEERYNLEGGWLRISQESKVEDEYYTVLHIHPGSCLPCPYGGNCSISPIAKPSYWGAQQNNTLNFYRCPKSYCCTSLDCPSFNTCDSNRNGKLCGKCAKDYTQALFSTKCVLETECGDYYIIALAGFLGVAYTAFLMFQKDITNWLMSSPVKVHKKHSSKKDIECHAVKSKAVINTVSAVVGEELSDVNMQRGHINGACNEEEENQEKTELNEEKCKPEVVEKEEFNDEGTEAGDNGDVTKKRKSGGSFLVLLFYYFQDAALIKIHTVYVQSKAYIDNIETVVSEIFRFRFNFFSLVASELCIFPGMDMLQREFLLAIFAPMLIFTSGLMYVLFKLIHRYSQRECWEGLALRALAALILGLLFSYQKLATTSMSFLYCVPVMETKILFLDGTVDCYETWQYITLAYLIVCIFPFSIHLAVAPAFLERGWISFPEFVIASIIPLPFLLSWVIRFRAQKKKFKMKRTAEVETIVSILQGPYRNFTLPGILKSFCWSGMIMARRLMLMIAKTFITNVLFSLSVAFVTCIFAILQHIEVKPYKDSLSNVAGTVSAGALVIVSSINLIKAAFEAAEYVPVGPVMDFMANLDVIESLVLVWIPLVGLVILTLALCVRVCIRMILCPTVKCLRR